MPSPGELNSNGFRLAYQDSRIAVGDCSRKTMLSHPCRWNFTEWPLYDFFTTLPGKRLSSVLAKPIGRVLATSANDVFILRGDLVRRSALEADLLTTIVEGDLIRDWQCKDQQSIVRPYDSNWKLVDLEQYPHAQRWFSAFRWPLENRKEFGGKTYREAKKPWFGYHQLDVAKAQAQNPIVFPDIVTHNHFLLFPKGTLAKDHSPTMIPADNAIKPAALLAIVNSSLALFWFKQVCFCKRESAEPVSGTYFELAGGKVETLPISEQTLLSDKTPQKLEMLVSLCQKRSKLSLESSCSKLFATFMPYEKNSSRASEPKNNASNLNEELLRSVSRSIVSLAATIAVQEEMDWLVYSAYGLLPEDHPAVQAVAEPEPLHRQQRPFVLWAEAEEDYNRAVALIPSDWSSSRRDLWKARLGAIRDNEYIRRIEQPVYKRRWDEQWKVGNQWRSGEVAYAAEFADAFEWWLKEKAEWWLENEKHGGPAAIDEWTTALWSDARVQAAWPIAVEQYAIVEHDRLKQRARENDEAEPPAPRADASASSFVKKFRELVNDESVPTGFEFGTPYEELARKLGRQIPKKLKDVRGKLNVPRERFHTNNGQYVWAGLQFREPLKHAAKKKA